MNFLKDIRRVGEIKKNWFLKLISSWYKSTLHALTDEWFILKMAHYLYHKYVSKVISCDEIWKILETRRKKDGFLKLISSWYKSMLDGWVVYFEDLKRSEIEKLLWNRKLSLLILMFFQPHLTIAKSNWPWILFLEQTHLSFHTVLWQENLFWSNGPWICVSQKLRWITQEVLLTHVQGLNYITMSFGRKTSSCSNGPWTCVAQKLRWITHEVLLTPAYTCSGVRDAYHSVLWQENLFWSNDPWIWDWSPIHSVLYARKIYEARRNCYLIDFNSFLSFNGCLMTKKLHESIICDPVQQKGHDVGLVHSEIMNKIVCKI